jgi:hypothetical protein
MVQAYDPVGAPKSSANAAGTIPVGDVVADPNVNGEATLHVLLPIEVYGEAAPQINKSTLPVVVRLGVAATAGCTKPVSTIVGEPSRVNVPDDRPYSWATTRSG